MESNKIIEKIQTILDSYKNNKAKTWEIGTDFYKTWIRLSNNLKKIKFNASKNKINSLSKILITSSINKKNEKGRFKISIGGYEITPSSSKKAIAEGALRQYLQEGSAMSLINYSARSKINDNVTFELNPMIWDLTKNTEDNLNQILLRTLTSSIYSDVSYVVNLGYSLFLSLIDEEDATLFTKIKNHIIKPRTVNKSNKNFVNYEISDARSQEFINHVKGDKLNKSFGRGKSTYVTATKELLNAYKFEDIVDYMYNYITNDSNDNNFIKTKEEINDIELSRELKQKIQQIQNNRSFLKPNIISHRVFDKNKVWSDLDNSDLNLDLPMTLIGCHIYDVNHIISDFRVDVKINKNFNNFEYYLHQVSDPNNGILLNDNAHRLFDNQKVWFDLEGKLCFRLESKKTVENAFGNNLYNVRIKQSIFNEKMKNYIFKKNSNLN